MGVNEGRVKFGNMKKRKSDKWRYNVKTHRNYNVSNRNSMNCYTVEQEK